MTSGRKGPALCRDAAHGDDGRMERSRHRDAAHGDDGRMERARRRDAAHGDDGQMERARRRDSACASYWVYGVIANATGSVTERTPDANLQGVPAVTVVTAG